LSRVSSFPDEAIVHDSMMVPSLLTPSASKPSFAIFHPEEEYESDHPIKHNEQDHITPPNSHSTHHSSSSSSLNPKVTTSTSKPPSNHNVINSNRIHNRDGGGHLDETIMVVENIGDVGESQSSLGFDGL